MAALDELQRTMGALRLQAILIEPGQAMLDLTGVRWGRSERTFVAVIPPMGDPAWVLPAFEEARARELIRASSELRFWQEDENPFAKIAEILRQWGISSGRIGVEETVRFFIFDGLRRELPKLDFDSVATPTLRRQ